MKTKITESIHRKSIKINVWREKKHANKYHELVEMTEIHEAFEYYDRSVAQFKKTDKIIT